jgi:hypothetical protein
MEHEPTPRVARVNRQDLDDMPAHWSDQERGQYLRLLLRLKGLDPGRLYTVSYYPHRSCWLLTQTPGPAAEPASSADGKPDEVFYREAVAEFRRTAFVALAQRPHGAGTYQLPPKPYPLTTTELADLLGGGTDQPPVRFDGEGGWQAEEAS